MIPKGMTVREVLARRKERKATRKSKAKLIFSAKPIKRTRKQAVARLDAIFSLFIRARDKRVADGKCVLCLTRPIEVCFHWVSRGDFATRWDERNAVGSCRGCNYEETFRKQKYRDMHIERAGLAVREGLEAQARASVHISTAELEAMYQHYASRLESGVFFSAQGVTKLCPQNDTSTTGGQ